MRQLARVSAWRSVAGVLLLAAAATVPIAVMTDEVAGAATSATSSVSAGWEAWTSSGTDPSRRLAGQPRVSLAATATLNVHPGSLGQTWRGVGAALTDASATALGRSSEARHLLFDPARVDGAHLNLVRLPLSATDFSTAPWTFGWNDDARNLSVPSQATVQASLLAGALKPLRPDLRVIGTPWTAPASMKDSGTLNGGSLLEGSVPAYGRMLAAQVGWLRGQGLDVAALTLGNEPYLSRPGVTGYPTMLISDQQQMALADAVGPAVSAGGTELWAVDHNWSDRWHYDTVEDGAGHRFAGSAFHCYGGSPGQMAGVREAPVITECTGTTDGFAGTFRWDAQNLVVGAVESGSTGLLMWNLALDENHGPHTNGCADCRGVVDVNTVTGSVTLNPEFFSLAHLARAADPGARVIQTDPVGGIPHVAFLEPDGTVGVFAYNDTGATQVVEVAIDGIGSGARFEVPAGNLATFRGSNGVSSPTATTTASATAAATPTPTVSPTATTTATTTATGTAAAAVVTNTSPPVVVGIPQVGRRLYVDVGEWSPASAVIGVQWMRSGEPIAGATSLSYQVVAADYGPRLSVMVRAEASGESATRIAATSAAVRAGEFTVLRSGRLAGTPRPGHVLNVEDLDLRPRPTLVFRWMRDGRYVAQPSGSRSSYRIRSADAGHRIAVRVTASARGYGSRTFRFSVAIRR